MTRITKPAFPTGYRVLGQTFRIEQVPGFVDDDGESPLMGDTGSDILGGYYRTRINADLDTRSKWSTLIHEGVHATFVVNGVANVLSNEVEEVVAQSVEHYIVQLLRQFGPELVRQFHGSEEE